MPTRNRPQIALVLMIVATGLFQLFSVTMASLPTNQYSQSLRPTTAYLSPFFTQNWRLFAPNPISEDRSIGFRGEYVDASGDTRTTPWLDWTDVELDLIRHQLVGGRAGYITNKMIGALNNRFGALEPRQRKIAIEDKETALQGYEALRTKLLTVEDNPGLIALYFGYETSIVRLATAALEAKYPDADFTAVRYRIVRQEVVAYDNRGLPEREAQKTRPEPVIRRSGWRKPIESSAAGRRIIAEFFARHR